MSHRNALSKSQISEIIGFTEQLADVARAATHRFCLPELKTQRKPITGEPVTELDIQIENEWRSFIRRSFPGHSIIGEETDHDRRDNEFIWLLDPIDGPDDLARGIPLYGSIITALYMGEPIAGIIDHPALDIRCQAAFGSGATINGTTINLRDATAGDLTDVIAIPAYADFQSDDDGERLLLAIGKAFPNQRIYRNVYAHTLVASGVISAAMELNVAYWDLAATKLIMEEADGAFVLFQNAGQDCARKAFSAAFGRADAVKSILEIYRQQWNRISPNFLGASGDQGRLVIEVEDLSV